MKQDAFTAEPPTITIRGKQATLRPMSHGFIRMATTVSEMAATEDAKGAAIVLGFAVVNSLPPAEAVALLADHAKLEYEIEMADQELSMSDMEAVAKYIEGVSTRQKEATVTVDGRAGKELGGETLPVT